MLIQRFIYAGVPNFQNRTPGKLDIGERVFDFERIVDVVPARDNSDALLLKWVAVFDGFNRPRAVLPDDIRNPQRLAAMRAAYRVGENSPKIITCYVCVSNGEPMDDLLAYLNGQRGRKFAERIRAAAAL